MEKLDNYRVLTFLSLLSNMFMNFLTKIVARTIKILLSYLSWQSHEQFVNPIIAIMLTLGLFLLAVGLVL